MCDRAAACGPWGRRQALAWLASLLGGCMRHGPPPAALNLSLARPTDAGKYLVEITPVAQPVQVNRIHSWQIVLRTAAGAPVQGATIRISGGMPEHGHGLPTQPRVSPQDMPGRYLLEGMKFSMIGWWEIKLAVESMAGLDTVTFNTVLPPSALS